MRNEALSKIPDRNSVLPSMDRFWSIHQVHWFSDCVNGSVIVVSGVQKMNERFVIIEMFVKGEIFVTPGSVVITFFCVLFMYDSLLYMERHL